MAQRPMEHSVVGDDDPGSAAPPAAPPQRGHQEVRFYYTKRAHSLTPQTLSAAPPNSSHASPCSGGIQIGGLYEIDHQKLPPKSPIQLKAIRVVKVAETTTLDVTVSFPSMQSLRSYFAGGGEVEMDERFVMGCNQAVRILRRLVPAPEVKAEREFRRFWLVAPEEIIENPVAIRTVGAGEEVEEEEEEEEEEKKTPVAGSHLGLQYSSGLAGWGSRRKVKYVGRQRQQLLLPPVELEMGGGGEERMGLITLPSPEIKNVQQQEQQVIWRKRTRSSSEKNKKKSSKKGERKRDRKRRRYEKAVVVEEDQKGGRGRETRWSAERYGAAEKKLLEIMRGMKAELASPVLRVALRDEARKHIGDTGLLDHLLKHMAGKTVGDGSERFRRRHNPEGTMEYWLEPADMAEMRRVAGVVDPYWVPPPGWKPGDAVYPCDVESKREIHRLREKFGAEISQLREELTTVKRDNEQLNYKLMQAEKRVADTLPQPEACNGCNELKKEYEKLQQGHSKMQQEMATMLSSLQGLKEEYQVLLELKSKKELDMAVCLQELKDEIRSMKVAAEDKVGGGGGGDGKNTMVAATNPASTNNGSSTSTSCTANQTTATITAADVGGGGGRGRAARRSGFRICKPQGTFLWPSMAGSAAATICVAGDRPLPAVPADSLTLFGFQTGGAPTPPSASSATSAHRLLVPPPASSPVPPRGSGAATEVVTVPVPTFPTTSQQRREEKTGSSSESTMFDLAPPRERSPAVMGRGGGGRGERRVNRVAPVSPPPPTTWGPAVGGGWSNVTTDLALATPSPNSASYR